MEMVFFSHSFPILEKNVITEINHYPNLLFITAKKMNSLKVDINLSHNLY